MASSFAKPPRSDLDYKYDWAGLTNGTGSSDWLDTANSETISSYTIYAPDGITVDDDSLTDSNTSVTVWVSGGATGTDYSVVCQIITSAGRTDERTMIFNVQSR